ncbi:hypothetical protein DLM76_17415 [Leptospira yasudae]|nr:hypothetical protein DLM76_17415 [Leptospira yasudae]
MDLNFIRLLLRSYGILRELAVCIQKVYYNSRVNYYKLIRPSGRVRSNPVERFQTQILLPDGSPFDRLRIVLKAQPNQWPGWIWV